MDNNKVDAYLLANGKYFDAAAIPMVREKLLRASDDQYAMIQSVELKDPTISLILSIFLGGLGVDRFFIGDIGMGVLKLLTGGCCGILTIIDWFTIMKKTKEKNIAKLSMVI